MAGIGDVTGWSDADLAMLTKRLDAEIAARDQFPDETLAAIVQKAQELHGREIDPTDVRAVLYAQAELAK